jgi:hypothetical protein
MEKTFFLPALLSISLLAGCSTQEKILLTDDASVGRLEQSAAPAAPVKLGLQPAEIQKIAREIFIRLLASPIGNDSSYSSVFLQADETVTAALMKQFPNRVPPIKQLWHLETRPGQSPLDKDTGRAAIILSVEVMDPENGVVVAIGKWFAGDAAAGFHTFEFKKNGDDWQILSVK